MTANEYIEKCISPSKREYPILLTWYDELTNEKVIVTPYKDTVMVNHQHDWAIFSSKLSMEELADIREDISLEQMSEKQYRFILYLTALSELIGNTKN